MKKNAMLKIVAVVLVAVLLTTCAISSTFAKYTSTDSSGTAVARVAKWGVVADAKLTGGFGKVYSDNGKVVSSADDDNVIAPGTSGTITLAATYSGTPEVSYSVDCTATVNVGVVPIKFYIGDSTTPVDNIAAAIEEAFEKTITDPKTNAPSTLDTTLVIRWEWDFDANTNGTINDNSLGNAYLTPGQEQAEVYISFKLDIVQTGPAGVADSYFGADNA